MSERLIRISIPEQRLTLLEASGATRVYPVSTAHNGPGERRGSGCTPRGWHRIRIRVGAGLPLNTVFVGRRRPARFTIRIWRFVTQSVTGF